MKLKSKSLSCMAATCLALAASTATAGEWLHFSDSRVTAQASNDHALDPSRQYTLTVEQSSGWSIGDLYWFIDQSWYGHPDAQGRNSGWYGEFSPRLSYGKISGKGMREGGLLKDVLLAATVERGREEKNSSALLLGIGFDYNLPGFEYASANLYARKQVHEGGFDTWQLTLSGSRPLKVGTQDFVIDGFLDYVAPGSARHWNLHFSPQIKWDFGANMGNPQRWHAGLELHYWRNKYGVGPIPDVDTNESTIGIILQRRL